MIDNYWWYTIGDGSLLQMINNRELLGNDRQCRMNEHGEGQTMVWTTENDRQWDSTLGNDRHGNGNRQWKWYTMGMMTNSKWKSMIDDIQYSDRQWIMTMGYDRQCGITYNVGMTFNEKWYTMSMTNNGE